MDPQRDFYFFFIYLFKQIRKLMKLRQSAPEEHTAASRFNILNIERSSQGKLKCIKAVRLFLPLQTR